MLPSPASLHRGMQTTPKGLACQLHSQPTECLADSSVKSAQGKQMCRWEDIYLQGLLACQVINVMSQRPSSGLHCCSERLPLQDIQKIHNGGSFFNQALTKYTSRRSILPK